MIIMTQLEASPIGPVQMVIMADKDADRILTITQEVKWDRSAPLIECNGQYYRQTCRTLTVPDDCGIKVGDVYKRSDRG